MNKVAKSVEAVFRDIWSLVGILLSGLALFNFLSRILPVDPPPLLERVLEVFRGTTYPLLEFCFGWLPFNLSPEVKDGVTLYYIFAGVVARTFLTLTRKIGAQPVHAKADPLMKNFTGSTIKRVLGVVMCAIFWPIMLLVLWQKPIVVGAEGLFYPGTWLKPSTWGRRVLRRESAAYRQEAKARGSYDHDLRIVFFVQLVSALFVAAGLLSAGHV